MWIWCRLRKLYRFRCRRPLLLLLLLLLWVSLSAQRLFNLQLMEREIKMCFSSKFSTHGAAYNIYNIQYIITFIYVIYGRPSSHSIWTMWLRHQIIFVEIEKEKKEREMMAEFSSFYSWCDRHGIYFFTFFCFFKFCAIVPVERTTWSLLIRWQYNVHKSQYQDALLCCVICLFSLPYQMLPFPPKYLCIKENSKKTK